MTCRTAVLASSVDHELAHDMRRMNCDGPCNKQGGDCPPWCSMYTCTQDPCKACNGQQLGCYPSPPPPPPPTPPFWPRRPPMPPPSPTPPWFPAAERAPPINFEARGDGHLYADGQRFFVKGVCWFGSENRAGPPLGLDKHPIAWYMSFLQQHEFNAIRFLFNHQMILQSTRLDPPNTAVYGADAPWEAPELEGLGYLESFLRLAEVWPPEALTQRPCTPPTGYL